jgi:hypothetical protein
MFFQSLVFYIPFLQRPFYTGPLGMDDGEVIILVAGSIFLSEVVRKAMFVRGK